MKKRLNKGGFTSFLIVIVVVVLAIGGSIYLSKNKKEGSNNSNTRMAEKALSSENLGAKLSLEVNEDGTIRDLMELGKDAACGFTTVANGYESRGVIFVTTSGDVSGDFEVNTGSDMVESHLVLKDKVSYLWSGSEGVKMTVPDTAEEEIAEESPIGLDAEFDFDCYNWTKDDSRFEIPDDIEFLDIDAMIQNMEAEAAVQP